MLEMKKKTGRLKWKEEKGMENKMELEEKMGQSGRRIKWEVWKGWRIK